MYIVDVFNNTNLHYAVKENRLELVWAIMKKNIDAKTLNSQNTFGDTALHIAAKNHNMDIVEYIARFGGKMNIKNSEDKTPLDYLSESEKLRFSEFQDCLYGLDKYAYKHKEESHIFMGSNTKRISMN